MESLLARKPLQRSKARLVLLSVTTLPVAGCDGAIIVSDDENVVETRSVQQPVQRDYWYAYEAWDVVRGSAASDLRARATGALRNDRYSPIDEKGTRASCGLTFVSPHYAITAAHCVNEYETDPGDTFRVQQYDTRNLGDSDIEAQAEVTGTWPNWSRDSVLTSGMGYKVTEYDCSVARRCGDYSDPPNSGCPSGSEDADILLAYCETRTPIAPFVFPYETDEGGEDIEVFWYHEVLDLPLADDNSPGWDHYGSLVPPSPPQTNWNWHYAESGGYPSDEHQLLPIRSSTFPLFFGEVTPQPYSALRRGVAPDDDPNVFISDMTVCHGTSGSGAFIAGTNRFLGPAVQAYGMSQALCHRMDTTSEPNVKRTGITHSTHTFNLGNVPEVKNDQGTFVALLIRI